MSNIKKRHAPTEVISVFHIPKDLLEQLEPVEKDTAAEAALDLQRDQADSDKVNAEALERLHIQQERLNNEEGNELTCNTCAIVFQDRTEQRSHFNTDWHRYNIKRRVVLNVEPVSFEEFQVLLSDLTESISGSESEDEEKDDEDDLEADNINSLVEKQQLEQEHQEELASEAKQIVLPMMKKYSALTWFKTAEKDASHYGIYKHLLQNNSLAQLQTNKKRTWTMIMLGGGHFAGCVIDVNASLGASANIDKQVKLITHKTFHRYTTRRKQGGSQSTNDNAKGAANSAGAQIRRHNEMLLQQEVRAVLDQWRSHIENSELVFVHAPSGNRKLVFHYDGAVLDPSRVKSIPFATRRPTLSELRRVFLELTTVKVVQVDEQAVLAYQQQWREREEKAKRQLEKSTMAQIKSTQQKKQVDPKLEKLLMLVKQNKTAVTLAYLEKNMNLPVAGLLPADELAETNEDLYHYPTLLHMVASMGGAADLIKQLLINWDADPTIVSEAGKTAYEVCKDKESRNAFRRCMCDYPDKWAWLEQGRVPSPLTEKQEQDQLAKDKKKQAKEQEKKRLIELERQKLEAAREAKQEQAQFEKMNATRAKNNLLPIVKPLGGDSAINTANMTPEARMRLEREKRARAAEERFKKLNK